MNSILSDYELLIDRPKDELDLLRRRAEELKGTDAEGWIIGQYVLRALDRAIRDQP